MYNKLRAALVENGLSVDDASKRLGYSRTKLYRQLKNADTFTVRDLRVLACLIGQEKINKIFFAEIVS
jgi:hypothetical protein